MIENVLPQLLQLLKDDHSGVRVAGVHAMVKLADGGEFRGILEVRVT